MVSILHDETKYKILIPTSSNGNTYKLEAQLQRRLLKLHKDYLLSPSVYETIIPTGSAQFCMYVLPKMHKDVPLYLIHDWTNST